MRSDEKAIVTDAIPPNESETDVTPLDRKSLDADIMAGARAYQKLMDHAADDWQSWSLTIRGLRAMREVVFDKIGNRNMMSQAYRNAMSFMLTQRKHAVYDHISKQARSACYKLADTIEEIDVWYATLPTSEKLRWKHPESVVKNAPKHLVEGAMRHDNKPPPSKTGKKKFVDPEVERLRRLCIKLITLLIKHDPKARKYLTELEASDDPDDGLPADMR